MKLLFIGDIVGQAGCDFIRRRLPGLRQELGLDVVIANGENAAEGNGLLPTAAEELFDSGVDVLTGGNHILRRRELYELLEENREIPILRPANYAPEAPGRGWCVLDMLRYKLVVVNLQGMAFMDPIENPFRAIDRVLAEVEQEVDSPNILLDFHAEATAEKQAMGYYLDGRVSAVVGTHTHVQTADERILPGGTGYMTDVGMCGGYHSVLGVRSELAIRRFRTGLLTRFENDREDCALAGVVLEIDVKTGKTNNISRIFLR